MTPVYRRLIPGGATLAESVIIVAEPPRGGDPPRPGRIGIQCAPKADPVWLTPDNAQTARQGLLEAIAVALEGVQW